MVGSWDLGLWCGVVVLNPTSQPTNELTDQPRHNNEIASYLLGCFPMASKLGCSNDDDAHECSISSLDIICYWLLVIIELHFVSFCQPLARLAGSLLHIHTNITSYIIHTYILYMHEYTNNTLAGFNAHRGMARLIDQRNKAPSRIVSSFRTSLGLAMPACLLRFQDCLPACLLPACCLPARVRAHPLALPGGS